MGCRPGKDRVERFRAQRRQGRVCVLHTDRVIGGVGGDRRSAQADFGARRTTQCTGGSDRLLVGGVDADRRRCLPGFEVNPDRAERDRELNFFAC